MSSSLSSNLQILFQNYIFSRFANQMLTYVNMLSTLTGCVAAL
jgi:hypothetical protein